MEWPELPYGISDIQPATGYKITKAIENIVARNPKRSISIQEISEASGYQPKVVKKVFYLLLSHKKLKATFLPRHKTCDCILGKQEKTTENIYKKIDEGFYWCVTCHSEINNPKEIQIQIIFWKPGVTIDL